MQIVFLPIGATDMKMLLCAVLLKATVDKGIHDKSTIIELPTLYKVPPKRDYGRYFCISARKEEPPHRGLMKNQAPFFMLKIRR